MSKKDMCSFENLDNKQEEEENRENVYKDIPDTVCSPEFPEGCMDVDGLDPDDLDQAFKDKAREKEVEDTQYKDIPDTVCSPEFPEGCMEVDGLEVDDIDKAFKLRNEKK